MNTIKVQAKRNVQWNHLTIISPRTGVSKSVSGRNMTQIVQRMAYRVTDVCRDTRAKESDFVEVEFTIDELVEFNRVSV